MPITLQAQSIILPRVWTDGTETETIDDLVEHTSVEFPTEYLHEKLVHITATEVALGAVVPGNLWCWIELSPYPSANTEGTWSYWPTPLGASTAYWAAIGGGGGAIVPTTPHIEVSGLGGAPGTLVHTIILPWEIHSPWARLVMQMPVNATPLVGYWVIQAMISAKTP
ncbi:hypothetical protein LCGC14_0981240 [marine sediment metagenome]|uniref:Uncharacterized protein n=1 Tax=marine sediment metagenome TaxID=412755 RepID=A0A0F9QS08_9ZZZZ